MWDVGARGHLHTNAQYQSPGPFCRCINAPGSAHGSWETKRKRALTSRQPRVVVFCALDGRSMAPVTEASDGGAAKTLCIPFVQPPLPKGTKCFVTGAPATTWVIWGRSY